MKKVCLFFKIFSPCIFYFYVFTSCETTSAQQNNSNSGCGGIIKKSTRIIRIQNDGADKIKLIDEVGCPAYTLNVEPGQDVKWVIDNSIIMSIDSIVLKQQNGNIFEKPPHKQFFSKHWKGKVKKTVGIETQEYDIFWKGVDRKSFRYDPLIQINPKIK